MKNMINITKTMTAVAFVAFAGIFAACNDDDLGEAERLFRPIATVSGTTSDMRALINVEWENPIVGATRYELELYRDSLGPEDTQFTPVATGSTTTQRYVFGEKEELAWDTPYYVRIKAVGDKESKFFVCKEITTDDYPTDLKAIDSAELIDEAVIIRWGDTEETYTVLDLTNSKDSVLRRYDISGADHSFVIEGLKANTNYKAKVYVGEMPAAPAEGQPYEPMADNAYRGKKTFKTMAAQDYENKYDLSLLPDEEAEVMICTAFLDTLADNATVLLKGGFTYIIEGATFNDKSVKFVSKYSLNGFANVAIKSNFKTANDMAIKNLEFENLNIYTLDADENTANYGGSYIFNINTKTNIENISFNNCNIRFFRGIVRTQAGPVVNNISFENCIINRIGGYGIANCDNQASTIEKVSLKKSTITYADKGIVNSKSEGTLEVIVDECTFAYSPASDAKSIMFDFNKYTPKIELTKCIFGITREGSGVLAFRSGSSADYTGSYYTSDFEFVKNEDGSFKNAFDLEIISKYNKKSTDLFKDPANLDFTLTDKSVGECGDPRWR